MTLQAYTDFGLMQQITPGFSSFNKLAPIPVIASLNHLLLYLTIMEYKHLNHISQKKMKYI